MVLQSPQKKHHTFPADVLPNASEALFIFISIHPSKKQAKCLWANPQFSLGPKHIFHKKYDSETKAVNKNQEG